MKDGHVIVVGGGVIGAMSAWYLTEAGCRVTIVDRDRFGAACSHGNCGYVSPSHVLPLAQPGAVRRTLLAMLKPNSPFAIKPRLSRSFVSWFWNFLRRCNRDDMLAAAVGRTALLESSMQLYQTLLDEQNIDCEWQSVGLLFVHQEEKEFNAFHATNELVREHFGVAATPYDGEQLVKLEPALRHGLGGAWHFEGDCHLRPDKLLSVLREKLEGRGVTFREQTSVDRFVRENGAARAIVSGNDEIEADRFVVATGAWTPFLNEHLGCRIPIEPGKGYSLTMPHPQQMPKYPMILKPSHVAITPMKSKYRVGSTMEFAGYDSTIHRRRLGLLRSEAAKFLLDPYCDPIEEEWFGWRPMTWDGKPVIDRSPAMNNVWIAAGHSMLGLSMATGTGRLVRELMLAETPHVDPSHFSLARFR